MSCLREGPRRWAAIGPAALLEMLAPLRDEHLRHGEARLIVRDKARPLQQLAAELAGDDAMLLVVEDPAEPTLRGAFPAPLLHAQGEAPVLLGWLRLEAHELGAYANRAIALMRRPGQPRPPVALLGPREQRYAALLDQLASAADPMTGLAAFHWGAERLARHRFAAALRQGIAAAIYTGHGYARGWFAYGGLTPEAFVSVGSPESDEAIGVLFSLACRTGAPAFADALVGLGVAGAVVAPLGDPLHEDNRALAAALIPAIGGGMSTAGDVVRALIAEGVRLDGYSIVGDPAIPVAASPGALDRCANVFAPAPDAVLAVETTV
jgi:hypothetical protein